MKIFKGLFFFYFVILASLYAYAYAYEDTDAKVPDFFKNKQLLLSDEYPKMDYSKIAWTKISKKESDNYKYLFALLKRSETGSLLLSLLMEREGLSLEELLESQMISTADSSHTNMTLKRIFDHLGNANYQYSSKILVDRNLNLIDASLDLAHELTHYLYRVKINPYHSDFFTKDGLKKFIISNIEGPGGEINAYLVECRVLQELNIKLSISNISNRGERESNNCKFFSSSDDSVARVELLKEFYKLGSDYNRFVSEIKSFKSLMLSEEDFPFISNKLGNIFISSLYDSNYPMALLTEYQEILKKVCMQDRGRIEKWNGEMHVLKQLEKSYQLKCTTLNLSE
ncbi:MAG: hypothetical protein HQK49_03210 [Oligoflexia bacterium]|nr:hypothetical protein [Oligoflexia bacterium]